MTTSKARGPGDGVVKTIVIKIGGSTLGEGDSTIPDIVELWNQGGGEEETVERVVQRWRSQG